jgi:transposase-like protein
MSFSKEGLKLLKTKWLAKYKECLNIAETCEFLGISRQAYYHWVHPYNAKNQRTSCQYDPAFVAQIDEYLQSLYDMAESKVHAEIRKGNMDVIKWFLSRKCRDRGWGDEIAVDHSGQIGLTIIRKTIEADSGAASHVNK